MRDRNRKPLKQSDKSFSRTGFYLYALKPRNIGNMDDNRVLFIFERQSLMALLRSK